MSSPFIGEFCGTATLILLGDGVVAGVLLAKSKANNGGWIVVSAGWCFAVVCGIFVSKALGGEGALNPAGPIADAILNHGPWQKTLEMVAGQFCGAFFGAILVWLHYLPHWAETKDQAAKLGVFCTAPAIRNYPWNFFSEFLGTFALIFIASAVGDTMLVDGMKPPLVGLIVWAIGLSLGGTTGYAINPARDLGPRLAHALLPIAGKGGSDWAYSWVPVVGPFAGAIAALAVYKLLRS
ncbi:MIP/aquaporin family protein [Anatilimnocola floriformis]|uniref:MIP/aquaporin family protein n=1 Tax=Anatilimnocola floriformis TaxID=2948575 RepID=UPI0020C4DD4D|nr:MIP/aquaporin family protein [Anatilimnocola floriformis]